MMLQTITNATLLGRILLSESAFPRLEAFSENALYYGRGIPTMKQYKTVKEVCALTGLTRKHLYYFHHAKVVQAVAYANYSVEGNDGYKLYDDAAVEKLQQIALYYQFGLKRDEIRDIMLDSNYDGSLVLDDLLSKAHLKKETIDRHIAALEFLKSTGTKNCLFAVLKGMSLEELGGALLILRKAMHESPNLKSFQPNAFFQEFSRLVVALQKLDSNELFGKAGDLIIEELFDISSKHLSESGISFVLGFFAGEMEFGASQEGVHDKLAPEHTKAVIRYLINHPELYEPDLHVYR